MFSQYGKLRPTNGWDRLVSLGHYSKFQRVSRLRFVIAPTSLDVMISAASVPFCRPNFARCLALSWAGTICIHFWGLLPPDGIFPGAKFTLRPSLALCYIDSVTARHSSSGRQPNCGVVEGIQLRNFRRRHHLYSAGWSTSLVHNVFTLLSWLLCSALEVTCSITAL